MGTYRDNTPNYNVNKVIKFNDFENKKDLESFKRGYVKNSQNHQIIGNKKLKFNKTTNKMDDTSIGEIEDKLKSLKESVSNESVQILQILSDYLNENPSIRFGQALFNLSINEFDKSKNVPTLRDIYNDTDQTILNRVKKNI